MREPENPTLGRYLAFLRQREEHRRREAGLLPANRKLSREKAAAEAHITASYLTKVERDEVGQVDVGILRLLASTYHADEDEWRYVCDLAGYASPYPGLAGLDSTMEMPPLETFLEAVSPIMRTEMEEADDLVSFYAPQRRLIAANRAYYDTFPTHRPGIYMMEWSFTEEAREVMINWEDQVRQGVAIHRGMMGRYGHTEWAQESHRRLWQFPEFRRLWDAQHVIYARPMSNEAHLNVAGKRYAMIMENWQMQHHLPIVRSRGRLRPLD
ncbi:helix-turn-helix domain-containing protein [Nocardia sp. BMG51109]|uniref:MmyB family transcriptional regulator n=1 Tax=Nocardia sp. BMG51109 TaxID=1056816 RepID=UPI0004661A70|nr:helix-turn-helix domain-containing protein [Nocardia sp. BMG51109]